MKRSTVRFSAVALAVLVSALAVGAVLGQVQIQRPGDAAAILGFAPRAGTATGGGNLKPNFSYITVVEKQKSGTFRPGYRVVVKYDDNYSIMRSDAFSSSGLNITDNYDLYYDGLQDFFGKHGTTWTENGAFPLRLHSQVNITDNLPKNVVDRNPRNSIILYVSDIVPAYPGFEWLKGPFYLIRQKDNGKLYAVWSGALNWPVYTQDWEVRGAVSEGQNLGETDYAKLIQAASDKAFAVGQTTLAERRADFEKQLSVKQVFKGKPVDVLPQYKNSGPGGASHRIDDPEAKIASSLAAFIPDGSTGVSSVSVRVASPAWWTVSRGNRKVYILGVPWLFKDGVDWNQFRLANRLRDLRGKIVLPPLLADDGPVAENVADIVPNADEIPDAYLARIQKAAAVIGQPADRYLGLTPILAGYRLSTDFRAKYGLQPELVAAQVGRAALHMNFNPRTAGMVHWNSGNGNIPAPDAGIACLDAALKEVDGGSAAFTQAMEAWAKGDVRTALTAPRGLEQCSFAFPVESEIRREGIGLQVDAIKSDLAPGAPGSVMVVYLRALLSEDGVLAQLQHQGYTIAAPIND
jgi:hypothetical protein